MSNHIHRYQVSYHCLFDLRLFPFDQQECIMQFRMRSATNKRVVFKSGTLEYFGHRSMVEFLLETIAIQDGLICYFTYRVRNWNVKYHVKINYSLISDLIVNKIQVDILPTLLDNIIQEIFGPASIWPQQRL